MTSIDSPEGHSAPRMLQDRLIQALHAFPLQKASELAYGIRADASEVLRCLSELQGITFQQDATYRWSLIAPDEALGATGRRTLPPRTEIARLCQYFLDCLGQDSDTGVSVPVTTASGQGEFAELVRHPHMPPVEPWGEDEAVKKVLATVRSDRINLEAWVGYPVRLKRQRTASGEAMVAEPVLLWRVLPGGAQGASLEEGMPQLNFSFLRSMALGGASEVVEEAAALGNELGLNNLPQDQPSTEELLLRLFNLRADWDWMEAMEPALCSHDTPLHELTEEGIYNRALVVYSRRSPYTQGLESELKTLSQVPAIEFMGTALDQWFNGQLLPNHYAQDRQDSPLIEVLPMNSEQREAVHSALTEPLTVVTGPPGTGKSQVVTNLLVNAAWKGMKVLFASKNNKAVDVVEARVNALGSRPVLLRLGSAEYQAKLSGYFSSLLTGQVGQDDLHRYQGRLARHAELIEQAQLLDDLQLRTVETRNYVDQLERQVSTLRPLFGEEGFSAVPEEASEQGAQLLEQFLHALQSFNPDHARLFDRLFSFLFKQARLRALVDAFYELLPLAQTLGVPGPDDNQEVGYLELRQFAVEVSKRLDAVEGIVTYKNALQALLMSPPLEDIVGQRIGLVQEIANNSTGLWKDWVHLMPSRLSEAEKREVSEYAAALKALNEPGGRYGNPSLRQKAQLLQQKVTALFSCWAVTSLSARGKIPLEPAYFDLVVIDEAGQCDIASALPLLYRAKRAVIIGDPMQLRHISALSRNKDVEFQEKHGLAQSRLSWLYSVNSLYDLAASVASGQSSVVNLRDHHRSHSDIIGFSNKFFYDERLRVATRHSALNRPDAQQNGVVWTHVRGRSIRPNDGGLKNPAEAEKVVQVLRKLLLDNKFEGTIGVVTPFRAQASLIQYLLNQQPGLATAASKADLLVDTVHKFQGDERDIIVFSPVISEGTPSSAVSFLNANPNLFNVAVTRARGLLHVVGDSESVGACGVEYLMQFHQYVKELEALSGGAATASADLGPLYPEVLRPDRVTPWERRLYEALYAAGIKTTPKLRIEQYELDLALVLGKKKLNIQIDGAQYHRDWTEELCLREQLRTQRLIEMGWEVKRFWVYQLEDQLQDCVNQVHYWTQE